MTLHQTPVLNGDKKAVAPASVQDDRMFTVLIGEERFGMPVGCVHTVFRIEALTPVPLAHDAVAGLLNLRGRIVTAISLRRRLGLPRAPEREVLAIGVEHCGESVALVVDEAGDVITLCEADWIPLPRHIPPARAKLTQAVYRLDQGLICILDMSAVFDIGQNAVTEVTN